MSRHHKEAGYGGQRWRRVRAVVLRRDEWRCRRCRRGPTPSNPLEVDHVEPVAAGGAMWAMANLQALCRHCHLGKSRRERAARRPVSKASARWAAYRDELRRV